MSTWGKITTLARANAQTEFLITVWAAPRAVWIDGVFDAVTITVYYWKNYQAYLVLIGDKVLLSLVSMKSKKLL